MEYQESNVKHLDESALRVPHLIRFVSSKWVVILVTVISVTAINSIYFLRLNRLVGQLSDDAFYIVLAKSIAEYGNYQLISSPIQGIQPSYPPGFPLLLASFLSLMPLDAEHLWILKIISILAINFLAIGMYIYCRRVKEYPVLISWLGTIMVTLIPALVFLATSSVMSECVFTCFQIWAVVRLETAIRNKTFNLSTIFTLLILTLATFYTRSLGVTLILAVMLQLFRFKLWRVMLILIFGIGLTTATWMTYAKYAYPNSVLRYNHGGNIVENYFENLTQRNAGIRESGIATSADYIFRITGNVKSIFGRDMVGLFMPATLRAEGKSGEEVLGLGGGTEAGASIPFAAGATILSLFLTIVILIGFITQVRMNITSVEILVPLTIALVVIWPWLTFRFILPLAPFLICYFIDGSRQLMLWFSERLKGSYDVYSLARIALFCFTFFFIFEHLRHILILRTNPVEISAVTAGNYMDEACIWMRDNLPAGSIIASTDPAKLYLMTDHLSVTGSLSEQSWEYWRKAGIRYLSVLRPQRRGALEAKYKIIFATDTVPSFHVIDLGDPAKKESWQEFKQWCDESEKRRIERNNTSTP